MNLREPYAATAFANLGWSEIAERPIDRVAAAGFADPLGTTLWKGKYQDSASANVKAVLALTKRVFERFNGRYKNEATDMSLRITAQCMLEYLRPNCETCLGRGETVLKNGVKIVCHECNGTQVKRYSDFDRARSMQISLAKVRAIAHKMGWLACEIQRLDSGVNSIMNGQLEKVAAA